MAELRRGVRSLEQELPAELNIYAVGDWTDKGLHWLAELDRSPAGAPLVLRAAGVEAVDAAGVQWLIALSHSLRLRERALVLDRPSALLQRAMQRLGAQALLEPIHASEEQP